jgi:hypothetical protein
MNSKKIILGLVCIGITYFGLVHFFRIAWASGIPNSQVINYVGTLTDSSGVVLTGDKSIQLVIWDQADNGAKQCFTEAITQTLRNGSFSIALPPECVTAIHNLSDLWAEIIVDSISFGRTKIGAVPYAVEADTASKASGTLASDFNTLKTELASIKNRLNYLEKPITYLYEGALATPTEWEADLIFNHNYKRFCEVIGKEFDKAIELVSHYHPGRENGFFIKVGTTLDHEFVTAISGMQVPKIRPIRIVCGYIMILADAVKLQQETGRMRPEF